eukprot:GILI01002239.1.p1 GENE.GILI01002239.1~~GILI01002239.1.p1  ORF type:complete len:299 (+),score=34.08 GILI01002239.1:53-898(+)
MTDADIICQGGNYLSCPVFDLNGTLNVVSQGGELFKVAGSDMEEWLNTGGQPNALAFDNDGIAYICDLAHQALVTVNDVGSADGERRQELTPVVKDYEGTPFLGPNSLVFARSKGTLFFTDSGPLGESSIVRPRGSVFAISADGQILQPLAVHCLAHPSGIALSPDENVLYVAETLNNRILRFAQRPSGVYHMSVFYQFSGRLGPSGLACGADGLLYVARFDFDGASPNGKISVLDEEGNHVRDFFVPAPEITGLAIGGPDGSELYATEASTNSVYRIPLR